MAPCNRTLEDSHLTELREAMSLTRLLVTVVLVSCVAAAPIHAEGYVQPEELAAAHTWFAAHFSADVSKLPFSFKLGEELSADVLARSRAATKDVTLDNNRTQRTIIWRDDKSGLETKVVAVEYANYPNVEWTVHFKNFGGSDSAVLSEIEAIDVAQPLPADAKAILHHQKGSTAVPNDFEPYEKDLTSGAEAKFAAAGGRGTNGDWPYFNLNWGDRGLIFVMGWPSQWDLVVQRGDGEFVLRGGQEQTHFKLEREESARTPLIVVQPYDGDWLRGQNIWRRWFVDHNLPRPEGKLPPPHFAACSSHQFAEMINANEENQKQFIDRYLEEKFPLDYWWMDAGWYVNNGAWVNTGTWEVDKKRFPNGLRAVTDHGRKKGVKSIVWFEPERVTADSWLYNERPHWLLTPPPNPGNQAYDVNWRLLNLANAEAREWLTKHVNALIESEGIDLYRQDFNIDPLMFWRNGEAEDRQGITENHYVEGYLAYWDALLAAHPNLRIDNCASGGRRIDLETSRRSISLLRSDALFEPTGQQAHHYGIALWLPCHGTATLIGKSAIGLNTSEGVSEYDFRSHMSPTLNACWDLRDTTLDYDKMRRLVAEFKQVSPLYFTDFYPLTPHNLDAAQWIAWLYASPEQGRAVVQAYRRQDSEESAKLFPLRGLDAQADYQIEALGSDKTWTASGADLMERGLEVNLEKRSAGLYLLTKK
jgi:alpha-galactosidase